jgi:alpha-beta hydrolase superfamily lysophospholipase
MTDTHSHTEALTTLEVPGWTIPAALTLPVDWRDDAELPSAILLVPGSLFSDVNGDYPAWNSFPHVYGHLARQLSAKGHAVYRFAKLGPGTGSTPTDPELSPALRNWDGRLAIARSALDAMRRELESRGVRTERTIAAGHSEGSVVVSRLAVSDAGRGLHGVVLLSGPSIGILGIMREQIDLHVAPAGREEARTRHDEAVGHIHRGERIPESLAKGGGMGISALANMPPEALNYMREVDLTDPIALAHAMPQPTLVVQGGKDDSVPTHHGERLRDALRSRGGAGSADYLFVEGVSHMYKAVPPDLTGPAAFGYPGPIDDRVIDGVDAWIRRLPPASDGPS